MKSKSKYKNFSSTWDTDCSQGALQSMVFKKSVLLCIDCRRFTVAIHMCLGVRFNYVFDDGSTARSVSPGPVFSHCANGYADITGIRNDCWRRIRCKSEFLVFFLCFIFIFLWIAHFQFVYLFSLFAAGRCCGPICDSTICCIFWILFTFSWCSEMVALAIPCVFPEICHGRSNSRHFWLQSTKAWMQRDILLLSNAVEIYENDWHASRWFYNRFCNTLGHLCCAARYCIFHFGTSP